MTASALAAQMQTQLQTVHASFTCTESGGVYTIACSTGTYSLTWTRPALRDFLGWSIDVPALTSSASGAQSPGVFTSSYPFDGDALGWEWSLKLRTDHRGGGSGYRLGKSAMWDTTAALIDDDERAQFLKVARRLAKGEPFTWFRDSTNTTAWAYTNWFGKVESVLHPDTVEMVDQWITSPHLTTFDVPLKLRVYTAQAEVTVSDFATAIESDSTIGLRWYAKIGGIGHIFLDGASTPIGPSGNVWATPTSQGVSYTLSGGTLDVGGGVRDSGPEIDRRTGAVTTRGMQVLLKDEDGSTVINDLLATDKSGGNSTYVTADIDYDTAGTGSVITVESTTGFSSTGLIYVGRECIYYPALAATTFGTAGNKASRGVFDLADADTVYEHEPDRLGPQVEATDFPAVWHGRWLSLYCYIVDIDGTAYDSAFDSSYSREVWRGVVQGDPVPAEDWSRWALNTRSIDQILNTDVGGEYARGSMLRFPGTYKQNEEGNATPEEYAKGQGFYFYVDESVGNIHLHIEEWASQASYDTPDTGTPADITAVVASSGQLAGVTGLRILMDEALSTAIEAEYGAPPDLQIKAIRRQHDVGGWGFMAKAFNNKVYEITLHMGTADSIGPLLGMHGDVSAVVVAGADAVDIASTSDSSGPVGLYIGAQALTIPFYYVQDNGILPSPPSLGFARVGTEIVEYGSITATSVSDLYQLDVIKRGAMGTAPQVHQVPISQHQSDFGTGNSTDIDQTEVVFGVGFDEVNPVHAFLQLATSTGSAHHGTYDVLGSEVGVPLNPSHFDTVAFERHADQLVGLQSKISLFLSKPVRLNKLAADLFSPFGRHIVARQDGAGAFKITMDELLPALESEESDYTIDSGNLAMVDPAIFQTGTDRIVTHVNVAWQWDVIKEEPTEDKAVLVNRPAVVRYGERQSITWQLIGQPRVAYGEVLATLQAWAQQVFERHGKPYQVARLKVGRIGWLLNPGDTILFTLADVPTATGTRGFTSESATVIHVAHIYQGTDRGAQRIGADLTVVLQPQGRASTYSPAAKIASYDSGAPSVTLAANTFTASGGTEVDADHFDNSDLVRIFNAGDEPGDNVTLSGKTGNTFTISGTLTITPGAATYMVARPYNTVQASQQKHVFIADNSSPRVLTVSDTTAFVYV